MLRMLNLSIVSAFLLFISGCAICQSPFDYTYDASGGRWQRTDPCCGRVGSAFTQVGHRVETEPDEPTPAIEELEEVDQAIYVEELGEGDFSGIADDGEQSAFDWDETSWKPYRE